MVSRTVGREFVIDIDINDYPERSCCARKPTLCPQCWGYLVVAIKIIRRALEEDWGYKRLLWVYSGRRGIHLWVCDSSAMLLSDKDRQNVLKSLNGFDAIKGKEVSTWRPEGPNLEVTVKKQMERMRRPIQSSFRYDKYIPMVLSIDTAQEGFGDNPATLQPYYA
jgi:DNA primase small subunit